MKKLSKILYCHVALLLALLLAGCSDSKHEEAKQPSNHDSDVLSDEMSNKMEESTKIGKDESEPASGSEESSTDESNQTSSEKEKTRRKVKKIMYWQHILLRKLNMLECGYSLEQIKR